MAKTTPATKALDRAGVTYTLHTYPYDPSADRIGLQAAEALGVAPHLVLKTLLAKVDGKLVCMLVPSNEEVSMKRLATAFDGRSAEMIAPTEAERISGYHVGGISPFGQKRLLPTVIEGAALRCERVFVNGGQRGLQVQLNPRDAARMLNAVVAELTPS